MKTPKRKSKVDPEAFGQSYVSRKFAQDHCFHYPWAKKGRKEFVLFLVNLATPTKSGYIKEKQQQMYRKPEVTANPEYAYSFLCAEQDIGEATLRKQYWLPKYYLALAIPKDEALSWYGNQMAQKDKLPTYQGEIKYF